MFLALVGQFLQSVQGLLHVVTTSTTGLETAGLAEESWHDKRGLTMALLVGCVMGSLSVLDQELGDYKFWGAFGVTPSLSWRSLSPLGHVHHVARTDHGLMGGVPAYQEGGIEPELVYTLERHSPGDLAGGLRVFLVIGREISVWLDFGKACG